MGRRALVFLCIALVASCGPIPTDPDDVADPNVAYVDKDWGFRVSRPDTTWGVQSQVFGQAVAANGLPRVEVWLLSPRLSNTDSFRPVLYLRPDAVGLGVSRDSVMAEVEGELQQAFRGYRAETKEPIRVDSETGTTWLFGAVNSQRNFLPGTRFWVTVVVHRQVVYMMLGNGIPGTFPLPAYQLVAERLVFLK